MMNTTYETYMNALKQGLASFDSAAAEEILIDFESHFADARSQGLSDEEICAELGNTLFPDLNISCSLDRKSVM